MQQTPRTNMTDLPNEILEQIFSYFLDDPQTLDVIKQTCRHVASVAQNIIASVKKVPVRGHTAVVECNQLLSIATPTITPQIRFLDVVFSSMHNTSTPLPASFTTVITNNLLPVLREITIHFTDVLLLHPVSGQPIARFLPQLAVQDFHILMNVINSRPQINAISRRLALHLRLDACNAVNIPAFLRPWRGIALQRFTIDLWDTNPQYIHTMLQILSFSRNTLTDLRMTEHKGYDEPVLSPRVDFSSFTSLLHLRVPACVWFTYGASQFRRLVPNRLQNLRVDFVGFAGIFASGLGYQYTLQLLTTDESHAKLAPAYLWITELVHPVSGLPHFKKLAVIETPHSRARDVMQRRIPTRVADAFRSAGVTLELQLRI
ncbi:hypothetical protein CC86DRAFT_430838 [Ophiobolus disseminans]|uniref:F-box domain-containing protein n=1 Tax=Ophiobolus disseminans TaxID=1469910 RepID=A0A6A7AE07_9PLEO|nr:hypothetical protein CC86DRAFT_430838 [Ophiobolus disseminans]